jgi:hypothetical protein
MLKGNLLREMNLETSNSPEGWPVVETDDTVRARRLTCRTGCLANLFDWMVT